MRSLHRTALVALIWLTAASTLLAGLPHFECACPAARPQPASPDAKAKAAGCCCSCCVAPPGEPEAQRPCCRPESQQPRPAKPKQTAKAPAGAPELTQSRCAKTLPPASDSVTAAVAKTDAAGWHTPELLAQAATGPDATLSVCGLPCRLPWLIAHEPPPTDLVITLQHFVI